MISKYVPLAFAGALALTTSLFATAQASVSGAPALMPYADATSAIQVKSGKGGGGGSFKGGSFKGGSMKGPGKMGPGPKGGMKGGPKGGPKMVKGKGKGKGHHHHHHHRFHGAYFLVPFGFALYAGNPCYDWRLGSHGWGYYWNYYRCPR